MADETTTRIIDFEPMAINAAVVGPVFSEIGALNCAGELIPWLTFDSRRDMGPETITKNTTYTYIIDILIDKRLCH